MLGSTNAKSSPKLTGSADADDVLAGETFYKDNPRSKLTGSLALSGSAAAEDVYPGRTFYNTNPKSKITGSMALTGDAALGDVLSGKYFYNTDPKNKLTGSLALSGNAAAGNVLDGSTFYNTDPKSKVTGSMTNRGAWGTTVTPSTGAQVVSIPSGYHNGSGAVTVNGIGTSFNIASKTNSISVTAGKTYVVGVLTAGNGYGASLASGGNVVASSGYASGSSTYDSFINLFVIYATSSTLTFNNATGQPKNTMGIITMQIN